MESPLVGRDLIGSHLKAKRLNMNTVINAKTGLNIQRQNIKPYEKMLPCLIRCPLLNSAYRVGMLKPL